MFDDFRMFDCNNQTFRLFNVRMCYNSSPKSMFVCSNVRRTMNEHSNIEHKCSMFGGPWPRIIFISSMKDYQEKLFKNFTSCIDQILNYLVMKYPKAFFKQLRARLFNIRDVLQSSTVTERDFRKIFPKHRHIYKWCNAALRIFSGKRARLRSRVLNFFQDSQIRVNGMTYTLSGSFLLCLLVPIFLPMVMR